jgi:ferritin-like metal-binding protein YciE
MESIMKSLKELFEHELQDIYYAEHQLVKALGEMAGESTEMAIKQAFLTHQKETEGQITRLDEVFTSLGQKPKAVKCLGIEGLIGEKKEFSKEKPSPEILDIFNLGAGAKTERYEITAYESLINLAGKLGLREAQTLLKQTLQEEEKTLGVVQKLCQASLKQMPAAMAAV